MPAAGEVEQFAYCAHNWWLARHGVDGEGAGVARGMRQHAQVAREQEKVRRSEDETARAFRWMFYVLGAAGSATFLTLELILLRSSPHHWIFLATALVLVGASAALLVIASIQEAQARKTIVSAGLVPGKVSQQGLRGESILVDQELDLRGAPDYVMDTDNGPVPVEVKTGHTPARPYPSHRLQLACYLHLLEKTQGVKPPYGLLTYPDGVFRVDWDKRLQNRLHETLERMAAVGDDGIDRDHQHAARCRGCARRDACDQRLT